MRYTNYSIPILLFILITFFPITEVIGDQKKIKKVRIGVLAKRGAKIALDKWGPTAEFLEKNIQGSSFEIVPLSYEKIFLAVKNEEVEFILANSYIYVELEMVYGVSRIATLKNLRMGEGHKEYGGVVFVRSDRNDIQQYSDLKGKTFMSLHERAFASWPAVWLELQENGIDPYKDFADLRFKEPMDAVVYAVRDGEVDAGSVRTDLLERMAMEGSIRMDEFRVLHQHGGTGEHLPFLHSTRSYPEWPMARTIHVLDELAEEVADTLLEMGQDSAAARSAKITGWTIPLNYQPVHETLKKLRIGPYKDYGKVTPLQLVREPWFLGSAIATILVFSVYLIRINKKLTKSVENLKLEITERKRAEEELAKHRDYLEEMVEERTKELRDAQEQMIRKEKLAVLGQLAGGIGHELRNPLGVISNAVYYLKMVLPNADETTKEYLETISSEVSQSTEIISDLLDLTKTKPAQRDHVKLSELIDQTLDRQKPPENVEVDTELDSSLPSVFVDSRQIGQVFNNLVSNAYLSMPEGGKVSIRAKAEESKLFVSIMDTGFGIPRENMKKLFEPLFTTRSRGFGLGLSVSKNLVEGNGGSIEVESETGKGSTFTVILPIV